MIQNVIKTDNTPIYLHECILYAYQYLDISVTDTDSEGCTQVCCSALAPETIICRTESCSSSQDPEVWPTAKLMCMYQNVLWVAIWRCSTSTVWKGISWGGMMVLGKINGKKQKLSSKIMKVVFFVSKSCA